MKNRQTSIVSTTVSRAALSSAVIALSACASYHTEKETNSVNDVPVNIEFSGDGCPQSASPENFVIDTAKRVVWQAVDEAGEAIEVSYEIYFDPFQGRPLKSNPKGRLKSPPFDREAPASSGTEGIEYKYSIVGDKCKHTPLDPRFRLRR